MEIKPLEITEIPADLRETCLTLIPSSYRYIFTHLPDSAVETIITLGAYDKDKLMGLVVTSFMTKTLSAEILFLSQEYTKQLLLTLEVILCEKKCYLVCMNYPAENAEPLEQTLQDLHWNKSYPIFDRYFFDTTVFPKNWFKQDSKWPKGFEEFSWNTLSDKEKEILKNQERTGSFPIAVSPFGKSEIIEPLNSLGLSHQGEVIGWMITHRIHPDTIRYTSLYIHPRYRLFGYSIKLLADSINLHLKHPIKWGVFDLNQEQVGVSWSKFVKKRLSPLAQHRLTFKRTWKSL